MTLTKALSQYLRPLPVLVFLVVAIPTASSWEQEECTSSCDPLPPVTYVPPPPASPGGYGTSPFSPPYTYWPPYPSYLAPPPPNWYYNAPPPPDPIWPFFPYYSRYPSHATSGGIVPSTQLATAIAVTILVFCFFFSATWV